VLLGAAGDKRHVGIGDDDSLKWQTGN
jgi:hypothetical protein